MVCNLDALRAWGDVLREVAHVVKRCLEDERAALLELLLWIGDDVGVAAITKVVGAAGDVEDQIPVDPAYRPVEEVLEDIHTQVLSTLPPLVGVHVPIHDARAVARLSCQDELIRRDLVCALEVMRVQTAIPVHTDTINH